MNGKDKLHNASVILSDAYDNAYKAIVEVVKANGGLIKTPAETGSRPCLYAFYEDFDGLVYKRGIHGLRWDDELGLTICTDDMLDNYQFDEGYTFEYYYDFVDDDAIHIQKVLDNPAYFVEWDSYDLVKDDTIKSIISGLEFYL